MYNISAGWNYDRMGWYRELRIYFGWRIIIEVLMDIQDFSILGHWMVGFSTAGAMAWHMG
jgi:hypothetical protein